MRGRGVEELSFDHQLPLGMFEDTVYAEEHFAVRPGDRLLIGSDGVHATPGPGGETYGERVLARSLPGLRLLPAGQVPAAVLRELAAYRGEVPLQDDAVVMCVDWLGR